MSLYDATNFYPPAPVATATMRHPHPPLRTVEVTLLIDTGSDVTMVPRWAVESMGLSPGADIFRLAGFAGAASDFESVLVDVLVLGRVFRGVYPIAESSFGFLGRDILEGYVITFDGPNSSWGHA